jgi:ferritin-like metal-binding protein YciE
MNRMNPRTLMTCAALGMSLSLFGAAAHGQSGDFRLDRGERVQERAEHASPEAREQLRERLRNRLSDIRSSESRLEEALRMLEAGEPVDAVRRHVVAEGAEQVRERREQMMDRRPQPGRRVGAGAPEPLTAEQSAELMRVLRETNPQLHDRLQAVMERDAEEGRKALQRLAPRLQHFVESQRRDPEGFEARREELVTARRTMELAREIRTGIEEGMAPERLREARDELRTLVTRQFELRMQNSQRTIAQLRERLERHEAEMQTQLERRDQLVEDRVNAIIRGAVEGRPQRPDRPGRPDDARPGGRDGAERGEGRRMQENQRPGRRGVGRDGGAR